MVEKVLVIGLDSAAPKLVFNEFRSELKNIDKLMSKGVYGKLKSCHPPITIPAWIVMMTSRNPGSLGLYGFRHRKGNSYTEILLPNSKTIKNLKVWDVVGWRGGKVCLVGVPPTYPPVRVNGCLISCLMTPKTNGEYTYPSDLKREVEKLVGKYIVDVEFRREDREKTLKEIYEMTEKRFKVIKYLLRNKPWNLFIFVEIGLDRIQHAFWKYFDKNHHLYKPGTKYEEVIKKYYAYLDEEIGEILKLIDDDTHVLIVSDHGAKGMKGAFCINQWLIEKGYLKINGEVCGVTPLEKLRVDWRKTIAWGWGGYYSRIFINVKGREAQGVIEAREYEDVRNQLAKEIKGIKGPKGESWVNHVYKPEDLYPECRGNPPDLMVYFDDLCWRAAGTIGHESLYLPENDLGPDDAVHDHEGIFIYYNSKKRIGGEVNVDILDVAPTILKLLGINPPKFFEGRVVEEVLR